MNDILGEQNALELDQEEVQQLGKVLQDNLLGLLGNSVVAARAEGAGNALLEDDLTGDLNESGHCRKKKGQSSPIGYPRVTRPTHIPATYTGT